VIITPKRIAVWSPWASLWPGEKTIKPGAATGGALPLDAIDQIDRDGPLSLMFACERRMPSGTSSAVVAMRLSLAFATPADAALFCSALASHLAQDPAMREWLTGLDWSEEREMPSYRKPLPQPAPSGGSPAPQLVYPQMPPGATTNGVAVAALITGLLGLSLIAVILGSIALSQLRKFPQRGHGMAVAGAVLGWLGLAALVVFVIAIMAAVSG
jgi:hypothetical protein